MRQAIGIGRVVISLAKVPVHHPVVASINRIRPLTRVHTALQRVYKVAGAVAGAASGQQTISVICENAGANRFDCAPDAGMSGCAAGRSARSDNEGDVVGTLSRDRSHNYATQTMSNQMNLAGAGLGQSLLNLFIQAALNQKVPAVCVDPDP